MILECEELLLLKSPQNKVKLSLAITEKKKKNKSDISYILGVF